VKNFEGKNIWIVGASSGIGRAVAVELHKQGANLILSARREEELNMLNSDLGGKHKVLSLNVKDFESMKQSAQKIKEKKSFIDAVLFFAGVYEPGPLSAHSAQIVEETIDINLKGAFHTVKAVLPIMEGQKSGLIALCASVAGYRGLPNAQPYSATKAGLINLAESLYIEEKPKGIDVKIINPGFVRTRLTDKNNFTMPGIVGPEEMAKAIVKGLMSQNFEIHFPKKLTFFMKILRVIPTPFYLRLAERMK
jgi:short-subunit dehydrogenase